KNGITIFMSIELMVNAVNLTFVAYARQFHQLHGLIFVFFIMAIAAAEAAVGLAIFISLFHHRETIDVDEANLMSWCRVRRGSLQRARRSRRDGEPGALPRAPTADRIVFA